MGTGVFEEFTGAGDGVLVELLVQPAINYALVHNRVPLVRQLTVTNTGRTTLADLHIALSLTGPYGPLSSGWERLVPRAVPPGGTVRFEDVADLRPDSEKLRGADEAYPVEYRLTATAHGREELDLVAPSRVLAHNEWFNAPALYDSLAAFVQPNTPAVQGVLRSAAQILLSRTGSGSLQGYQAGPLRASQIAGAVYEALRQLAIEYQELPPSFEGTGQKVRGTAAVLDGRAGNCVDLAVTYAACLEAAGLHPLIWLTDTHAFGGFLVADERLSSAAVTEANLIVAMVRAGRAVPVELTAMGAGKLSEPFPIAVEQALAYFRERGDDLAGVVDVHLAHRSGIQPLPSATGVAPAAGSAPAPGPVLADEQTMLLPLGATAGTTVAAGAIDLPAGAARALLTEQEAAEPDEAPSQVDDSPARVQRWKKSLLDLSLRNPLLNLPARGRGVDLHVPAGSLALLDDLVHDGKPIEIVPQDEISGVQELAGTQRAQQLPADQLAKELTADRRIYGAVPAARYLALMRTLQRDARTMVQETGSNNLYLTLGTLVHNKSDGTEAHAPLFLLPVRIEGGTGRKPYTIVVDGTESATPNYCLIEWLRVKHGVEIPELERPATDEHGIDIPRTMAGIHARLVDNRLNYRLDERATLRLLQFSTFQMWRDLTDNWAAFLGNPVVRHLVEGGGARFTDPATDGSADPYLSVDEAGLHLPIPADGSQMQAIVLAEQGRTFVLEGPPGTGKSQTITNLIARAIVAGRTVLFVAEKQAALDVVKRRLHEIGLGPFALDLHGRKQSMREIREQLRTAMEVPAESDRLGWQVAEAEYRTRLAPLAGYPAQVHAPNAAGLSLWSAYETQLAYGPGPVAPIPVVYLSAGPEQRAAAERALRDLPAAARSVRLRPAHPWSISGRRDIGDLHGEAVTQLAAALEQARAELAADPALARIVSALPTPDGVAELVPAARYAAAGALPDLAQTRRASDPRWDVAVAALREELLRFHRTYAGELVAFRPEILGAPELATWQAETAEAAGRLFGKRKRLAAVVEKVRPYLRAGAVLAPEQIAGSLDRLVAARVEAGRLYQRPAEIGGLRLPAGWLPTDPDAETVVEQAVQASLASRALLAGNASAWSLFAGGVSGHQVELLGRVAGGWRAWLSTVAGGEIELTRWAGAGGWAAAWQRDGAAWLTELGAEGLYPLHRWANLLLLTDVLADAGLRELRDVLLAGELDGDAAEAAYHRGVAAVSVAERQQAGGLAYFDPEQHDGRVEQYAEAADRLRAALPAHLPGILVGRRADTTGPHQLRLAELGTELRRKRGGRTFRELFGSHSDEILALTPCVLVSPASAAYFLAPGAATFDLVVFDEASQIRVAESIGAMGRGRAVVIVGDSKQMPPTSIMQSSHESEYGEEPATVEVDGDAMVVPEDLDSILSEAVESGLPQRWLSWHYRSRDEALIAFSNRFYYEGKLSSLPAPANGGTAGIAWRRLDGRFDRGATRVNMTEAEAVVAEIAARLADPATAEDSIGVVTFNLQQRDLILNLLEESPDPLIRKALGATDGEPIFVKNLENVQGDERDVILFSLAFAKDPKTGVLPLNFGPLSQVGGERRLNVAITRARRQVILFASFDPKDIDLSRTAAVGTAHLRAYCELAADGTGRFSDLNPARPGARDRVREEVALALRERGFEVQTGYGLSDFTVDVAVRAQGSAHWQVAVLLDSPRWAARPTVADRDGAPELLRTVMGWPEVVRCWLPSWVRNRAELLDRVAAAVQRASAAPAAPSRTGAQPVARPALEPAAPPHLPSASATVPVPMVGTAGRRAAPPARNA